MFSSRIRKTVLVSVVTVVVAGCSAATDPAPASPTTGAGQAESEVISPETTLIDPAADASAVSNPDPSTSEQPPSPQPDVTSSTGNSESTPSPTATTSTSSETNVPSTTSLPAATPPQSLRFVEVAAGVRNPIFLTATPGASHSYLAEQGGRVHYMINGSIADPPVLDISDRVRFRGEQGLLGMALHPSEHDRLFLHYSDRNGHTVVSEFSLSEAGRTVDPNSERIIFTISQPASNHNGGMIQFGPDGYLYLGMGDGGRADDYFGQGQRPDTPLAAMVRIEVDQGTSEVWWHGLRNPWRFWIDEPTGLVYVADVGQDAYEEVSVALLSEPGLNFGWPITEGFHCFEPRQGCNTEGLTLPVLEIPHGDGGTCSVTGGIVYRGSAMPGLWGHYLYSDYCGEYLRSFRWDGALAADLREWATDLGPVVSFGTDGAGEMYVLTSNTVYRVDPGG